MSFPNVIAMTTNRTCSRSGNLTFESTIHSVFIPRVCPHVVWFIQTTLVCVNVVQFGVIESYTVVEVYTPIFAITKANALDIFRHLIRLTLARRTFPQYPFNFKRNINSKVQYNITFNSNVK